MDRCDYVCSDSSDSGGDVLGLSVIHGECSSWVLLNEVISSVFTTIN